MTTLDWSIIAVYMLVMVLLSLYLGANHESEDDYFLAGRTLPWWAVGLSTIATQSSAISFVAIPAFVAMTPDGTLTLLRLEPSVPLAMAVIILTLAPLFRKLSAISIYAFLEQRFNRQVRLLISGIFLLTRGLSAGITTYAVALVLSICLDLPLWVMVLLIGAVTVLYDVLGGMAAVVWSDVLQLIVLISGLVFCLLFLLTEIGGYQGLLDSLTTAYSHSHPESASEQSSEKLPPLWTYISGALFLFTAYYGADQSQAQRQMSARSHQQASLSLVLNALVRMPLHLLYIGLGLGLGLFLEQTPELQQRVNQTGHTDTLVPLYILYYLPEGTRALIVAGILAAAMSSLDSTLNSLSAVTLSDFLPSNRQLRHFSALNQGRIITLIWGIFIIAAALATSLLANNIIDAINKTGSLFYGPVLATFLLGLFVPAAQSRSMLLGVMAGIGTNIFLWQAGTIHWILWNPAGFFITVTVTFLAGCYWPEGESIKQTTKTGSCLSSREVIALSREQNGMQSAVCMLIYGVILTSSLWWLEAWLQHRG